MKTHCKFGHPRTPENLYANGGCRTCGDLRSHQKYQAYRLEHPKRPKKTHCVNGHPRTPENIRPGGRSCKICDAAGKKKANKIRTARARELRELRGPKPPRTHCVKGHPENRNAQGQCRACRLASRKRRNKAHPEMRRAWKKRYFERHPEAVLKRKAKSLAWAKANPEKIKAYSKAHPRKPRTRDENRAHFAKRRARKKGNGGSYTLQEERALRDFYGHHCVCCGRIESELAAAGLRIVLDHVVPISKGGTSFISNLQPLCHGARKGISGCNEAKCDFHDTDYRVLGLVGLS